MSPCDSSLGVGDVRSGLYNDSLSISTEAVDSFEGIYSYGIAKMILKMWETRSARLIVDRWREIRQQPEFDVFRIVGKESGVDSIKEMINTIHVEPLSI